MSTWLPGDLILTRSLQPPDAGSIPERIATVQSKVFKDPAHHLWTHAAVYVGAGEVIEAEFDRAGDRVGVLPGYVSSYVPEYIIRVRRDSRLTPAERDVLVKAARGIVGSGYSLARAAELAAYAAIFDPAMPSAPDPSGRPALGFVCSDVYAFAYFQATDRVAAPWGQPFQSPASLSYSTNFDDLPVRWCSIPPGTAFVAGSPTGKGKGK